MITLTEIKKAIYNEKPRADLVKITKVCQETSRKEPVYFCVPLSEIGDTAFTNREKGELMIRYIVLPENTEA